MTKWLISTCLLSVGLLTACSGTATPSVAPDLSIETDRLDDALAVNKSAQKATPSTQPDFGNLFAETNQLYDQLEANTPIEVVPANTSAQTVVLTVPTIF